MTKRQQILFAIVIFVIGITIGFFINLYRCNPAGPPPPPPTPSPCHISCDSKHMFGYQTVKLMIGQNDVDQFNDYIIAFPMLSNRVWGGSIYTSMPETFDDDVKFSTFKNDQKCTLEEYITSLSVPPKYIQTTIAFKYKDWLTYAKFLDEWSKESGNFTYITKYAHILKDFSHIHWLVRFEYEVSIDQKLDAPIGPNWLCYREKYARAFLLCRQKFTKICRNAKFVFHPVIGAQLTDEEGCWLPIFEKAAKELNILDPYPDMLGLSSVFAIYDQVPKMAKSLFKTWKEKTKKSTIFSETSVKPKTCIGASLENECTSLQDLLETANPEWLDFFVYINTTENIAETPLNSAVQLFDCKDQQYWADYICHYCESS